jgi:hypothetical protein
MKKLLKFILVISIATIFSTTSSAAIYKCPSKNGSVVYSDSPCGAGERKDGDQWVNLEAKKIEKTRQAESRNSMIEKGKTPTQTASEPKTGTNPGAPVVSHSTASSSRYRCDGRLHCSQMTSCEEAKFFLMNCPNTEMDGDNDGIPCEQQWCDNGR